MDNFDRWFLNPTKQQYFDFDGRATRQQYWMYFLWVVILSIVVSILSGVLGFGDLLANLFALAFAIPQIAFGARRLHDIGKSGWWQLIYFVPIIGLIVMLVWLVRQGEAGSNKYGADPRTTTEVSAPESVTPVPKPDSSSFATNDSESTNSGGSSSTSNT